MKTLILTEKPSVARDFARALGVKGKKDGFMESETYVITWAVGHLVELYEPQDYDAKWRRWQMQTLPIIPETFRYKPIKKTKKQLNVIRRLAARKTVDRVIIATDAGREGEVIARTILLDVQWKDQSKIDRFWTSQALTPNVVKTAMASLKPASDFDRLWRAGRSRQIADWLVGMNGSRSATIKMSDLFSIGRVQTAVLALIVDRRRERENFKPEPYWLLRARFECDKGTWWGLWFKGKNSQLDTAKAAEAVSRKISGKTGTVIQADTKKKKEPPPLLYALTDLQRDANARLGFSAKKTLTIAQGLYEKKKCLSYPRTDAKVLGSDNVGMVKKIVNRLSPVYTTVFSGIDPALISRSNKRVFNDARLTDHHALIPLAPLPANATADEKNLYDLVLKRFGAAFHPDCEFEQTTIVTEVEKERFKTQGKVILKPGWREVYAADPVKKKKTGEHEEQENLPQLKKGDPARTADVKIDKKMTQPPPEYSEALLLKDMTNPSRYVEADELKKIYRGDVGLGTQATRAQIIETLLRRKYISRRQKKLIAEDKGCVLVDTLRTFKVAGVLTSAEQTARWEMQLDRIARGKGSDEEFLAGIVRFVRDTVEEFKSADVAPVPVKGKGKNSGAPAKRTGQKKGASGSKRPDGPKIGTCPQCGGEVVDGNKGYGCANWRDADGGCRFVIWKSIARRNISKEEAVTLIEKKVLGPLDGFMSRADKPFSTTLRLCEEGEKWGVTFDFSNPSKRQKPGQQVLGTCPACGGNIIEGKRGYGCANWREIDGGCRFVVWKEIEGKHISKKELDRLLKEGRTDPLDGFVSRDGRPFSASLVLEKIEGESIPKVTLDF